MGTWSAGVLEDDFARDVYDACLVIVDGGGTVDEACTRVAQTFASELVDPDVDAVFWFAVARAALDRGQVSKVLRERVQHLVAAGVGLTPWREAGAAALKNRKAVLTRFMRALAETPRPRKRATKTAAASTAVATVPFVVGDCIAVHLPDGRYAGVVVTRDNTASSTPSLIVTVADAIRHVPLVAADFSPLRWLILAPAQYPDLVVKYQVYSDGWPRARKHYQHVCHVTLDAVPAPLVALHVNLDKTPSPRRETLSA